MTFQRKFSLQKVDDFLASDAADSFTQIFGEFFEIKKYISWRKILTSFLISKVIERIISKFFILDLFPSLSLSLSLSNYLVSLFQIWQFLSIL